MSSASARTDKVNREASRVAPRRADRSAGRRSRGRCLVKITRCTGFHKYSCFHNCSYPRVAHPRRLAMRFRFTTALALRVVRSLADSQADRHRCDIANLIANSMDSMEADIGRFREIVDPRGGTVYERRTWKSEKDRLTNSATTEATYRTFRRNWTQNCHKNISK